jgi:glycosyltransferase involved in cell wall biosynthesis
MSNVIRVLHTEWSNGWGGQEMRIIAEMLEIRSQNIEVFLACRDQSYIKKKALENNIQVFILPFRGNFDFVTLFALKKIINKYSIDIVNTHSGKDTWVGGLAAKMARKKFIRTRHLSNPISTSPLNFINRLADYIITTGESVRSTMIKINHIKPNKIQSIPTGIDPSLYNPNIYNFKECRGKFDFADNQIVIGILAVLRQFKRHDLFLEMAKDLIKLYPNKKLLFIIAGNGPQKNNIQKRINDLKINSNVRMLGHTNNVPEFLMAIDILVLSSDSKEGVPQSVMQGLFMNKPIVATSSGSTKDLLVEDSFKLVNAGDTEALVKGVSYYLDGNSSQNSREHMINFFTKNNMIDKILRVYEVILQ